MLKASSLPPLSASISVETACKMQIHPPNAAYNCTSPAYRSSGHLEAYKDSKSRLSDPSRLVHEFSNAQKPTLSNTNRALTSPYPACSWRERVLQLFDPALQDAEDMMLSLPYTDIREKTQNFARVMDGVASSGLEGAASRQSLGSRSSPKPKGNRTALSVTRAAVEGRDSAQVSGDTSTHRQHYDSSMMAKALCEI